jgi:tetratricopeptide (TPR) repeat protein
VLLPRSLAVATVALVALAATARVHACEPAAAEAVSVQGTVERLTAGQNTWRAIRIGDALCDGDGVRVLRNSRAVLLLADDTSLALDQNTTVTFGEVRSEESSWLQVLQGALYFLSRTPEVLKIGTAHVNGAIEGTEFALRVDEATTRLWVFEGQVALSNPQGELRLGADEASIVPADTAPQRVTEVRPRDAVRWALHYPPILDLRPGTLPPGERSASVLEAYRRGDVDAALRLLQTAPPSAGPDQAPVLEAGLLLTVGRVDEAQTALDAALRRDPDDAAAVALQSVIATARNRPEEADRLAQRAVALDPRSPPANMALSYAKQARFDLPGATAAARRAVDADPENALAWARLSELSLAQGERRVAVEQAERAAALDPRLARSQTVLGFALLGRADIASARRRFERAAALDPASPLARLGLGLSLIRANALGAGVDQLELAVTLDPDNSLLRSYLGKGYYEQRRPELAAVEFGIAEQLDPLDPTPRFYDSILLLTINRPIEALQQNQAAIALNDNRAVFRSRLLLDDDLAARSVAQGRIFDTLGFQQLGLLEGMRALQTDPSNFSAHRLMADLYASVPRHEVARVSELMQSQLLQPANIVPIQPQVSANNLGVLRGLGPASLGFNEYTPMFARNGFNVQLNALAGTQDTYANDLVLGYVHDNVSMSIGQFHYQTQGYRENSQDRQDIVDAVVQFDVTPELSLQLEGRHRERSFGDLEQTYDGSFDPTRNTDWTRDSIRGGIRWSPTPDSDLILSLQHASFSEDLTQAEGVIVPFAEMTGFSDVSGARESAETQVAPGVVVVTTTETTTTTTVQTETAGTVDIAVDVASKSNGDDDVIELLYLLRRDKLDAALGGGYFWEDQSSRTLLDALHSISATAETRLDIEVDSLVTLDYIPPLFPSETAEVTFSETVVFETPISDSFRTRQTVDEDVEVRQGNLFGYLTVRPLDADLSLILGLSYDRLDTDRNRTITQIDESDPADPLGSITREREQQQINRLSPKLGLVWSPNDALTLRAAWFQTVSRSLIDGRTVEPTQVAGFNQLYDDLLGTEMSRAGIGLDYRFSERLFGGIELSERSLTTPGGFDDGDVDQDESLHRAYLYWTPSERVAIHGQAVYDDYSSDAPLVTDAPTGVRDFFIPMGVRYFGPHGLFGGIMGTYVDQHVELETQPASSETFWVWDAAIGYRLPRRQGTIMLQGKNLLDTDFNYQDSNFRTNEPVDPRWIPARSVFLTISLAL